MFGRARKRATSCPAPPATTAPPLRRKERWRPGVASCASRLRGGSLMSLRFFTDHCVPNSVIQVLRDAGHEVFILKEHIPQDSDDPVVIAKAQELDAVLVSLNGDFADIVTYPPSDYK